MKGINQLETRDAARHVDVPTYVDGTHPCTYDFETDGLVGATRVAYLTS